MFTSHHRDTLSFDRALEVFRTRVEDAAFQRYLDWREGASAPRLSDSGQVARIAVNHRTLGSVVPWSQLVGEHFAGTLYAKYLLSHDAARATAIR